MAEDKPDSKTGRRVTKKSPLMKKEQIKSTSSSCSTSNGLAKKPKLHRIIRSTPNQEIPTLKKLDQSGNEVLKKLHQSGNEVLKKLHQSGTGVLKKKPIIKITPHHKKSKPSSPNSKIRGISVNNGVGGMSSDVNFTPATTTSSKLLILPFDSNLAASDILADYDDENPKIPICNSYTKTPPVEISLSPEIQSGLGSLVLSATISSICYGAGHVLSGVTNKRKCKPRGMLTIAKNNNSKSSDFDDIFYGVDGNSSVSLIPPLPIEASVHWLSSPCKDGSNQSRRKVNSPIAHSLSPLSDGEICDNVCSMRRMSNSLVSPSGLPELGNWFSPLADKMESCSLPSSRPCTPVCVSVVLEDDMKHEYDIAGNNNSPFSLGSGNVIQTPQSGSDSRPYRNVDLCLLNSKNLFEFELDSAGAVVPETSFSPKSRVSMWHPACSSFHFDHLHTSSSSIDFMQLQKDWDHSSWIFNSTSENVSQSQMSRIFEMDELDCCRCLSDEEEDALELNLDENNDQMIPCISGPPKFVVHEKENDERGGEECPFRGLNSCAESISTDGGGLLASGDSDWTLCYRNTLSDV